MEKKRSGGVIVFAIIFMLIGGLLVLLFFKDLLSGAYPVKNIGLMDFISIGGCLTIALTGVGLLFLKPWARHLTLYVIPVFIFFFFCELSRCSAENGCVPHIRVPENMPSPTGLHAKFLFYISDFSYTTLLFGLGLIGVLIYFFTRPKVKEQFK